MQHTEETHKPWRNLEVSKLSFKYIYPKLFINHLYISKSQENWGQKKKKKINSLAHSNSVYINRKAFRDLETLMNIIANSYYYSPGYRVEQASKFSASPFIKICNQTNMHSSGGKSHFNADTQWSYIYCPIAKEQAIFFEAFQNKLVTQSPFNASIIMW